MQSVPLIGRLYSTGAVPSAWKSENASPYMPYCASRRDPSRENWHSVPYLAANGVAAAVSGLTAKLPSTLKFVRCDAMIWSPSGDHSGHIHCSPAGTFVTRRTPLPSALAVHRFAMSSQTSFVPSSDQRGRRPCGESSFVAFAPSIDAVQTPPLQSSTTILPSVSVPPIANEPESAVVVFQPSVVVTRTRTSPPASWRIAFTVSDLALVGSLSGRHVAPPSSEIEIVDVSASPSASVAVQLTCRSSPIASLPGVST